MHNAGYIDEWVYWLNGTQVVVFLLSVSLCVAIPLIILCCVVLRFAVICLLVQEVSRMQTVRLLRPKKTAGSAHALMTRVQAMQTRAKAAARMHQQQWSRLH